MSAWILAISAIAIAAALQFELVRPEREAAAVVCWAVFFTGWLICLHIDSAKKRG